MRRRWPVAIRPWCCRPTAIFFKYFSGRSGESSPPGRRRSAVGSPGRAPATRACGSALARADRADHLTHGLKAGRSATSTTAARSAARLALQQAGQPPCANDARSVRGRSPPRLRLDAERKHDHETRPAARHWSSVMPTRAAAMSWPRGRGPDDLRGENVRGGHGVGGDLGEQLFLGSEIAIDQHGGDAGPGGRSRAGPAPS